MNGDPQLRRTTKWEARDQDSARVGALATAGAAATGVLAVDLAAVRRNYRALKAAARGAECAAVVKADAYGLGARPVVKALVAEGCGAFFVATLAEARAARECAPSSAIYVLDGLFPGAAPEFAALDARPTLASLAEITEWAAFRRAGHCATPAALQIDTGMNRLGLSADDLQRAASEAGLFDAFPICLILSHLACADEPAHPMNRLQRDTFAALAALLPRAPLSLANSGGVFLGSAYHFNLVRPGIALYGGNPVPGIDNPMAPAARLWGRIAQVREAAAGEAVGYGAARTLTRRTRIAVAAAGYGDGYFRALGSSDQREGACAYLGDWRAPILGRVSMDLAAFDVTDAPEGLAARGGFLELMGPHISVDELAAKAGTISYEILTNMGRRCHRVYANE